MMEFYGVIMIYLVNGYEVLEGSVILCLVFLLVLYVEVIRYGLDL